MADTETINDGEIEEKIKMEAAKSDEKKAVKKEEEEDEEEVAEGELPPALKKAIDAKKKKGGDDKEEDEDKEEKKESKKVKKEEDEEEEEVESKKEEIEINVDEDVAALIDGEELSEAFKTKAATIFEAAVKSKISKIRKQIREESKERQGRAYWIHAGRND